MTIEKEIIEELCMYEGIKCINWDSENRICKKKMYEDDDYE